MPAPIDDTEILHRIADEMVAGAANLADAARRIGVENESEIRRLQKRFAVKTTKAGAYLAGASQRRAALQALAATRPVDVPVFKRRFA